MADLTKWKLVPVEPMPEMLGAFWRVKNGHHFADEPEPTDRSDYAAYRAMLSASPAPSLPTREEIARVIDETAECHSENRMDMAFLDNSEEIADRILALFAQPQEKKP